MHDDLDIMYAEDDDEDYSLFLEAVSENGFSLNIHRVHDGQELVDYFSQKNRNLPNWQSPRLIISDLNMPRKNGHQALKEIREESLPSKIPIIIYSNSKSIDEVNLSYDLGVNSFIQKPLSYQGRLACVRCIHNFWFKTAIFP